jgi:hypothetical protein
VSRPAAFAPFLRGRCDWLAKYEHLWNDVEFHVCEVDLNVGGKYHYAWYAPGDNECSFRGTS